MSVWSGFGVNYKNAQSNWTTDQAYFRSIGLNNIRPHLPGVPTPWANDVPIVNGTQAQNLAYWRQAAQTWHNAGFWVLWGVSGASTPVTVSDWQAYHDAVVAEATYLQSNNIVIDEFVIGNEREGNLLSTLNSLSQTSGTATATTTANHRLNSGDSLTIYNTSPVDYSGTVTVTVVDTKTFTYSVSPSAGLPSPTGGGSYGSCYSLSIPQLNANLRQLATDVKAVYNLGKISYGCFNQQINGGTPAYTDWINNGLGGLDTISIHPYSNINLDNMTLAQGGYAFIAEMVAAFPNQVYISEFNLDSGTTKDSGVTDALATTWMQQQWSLIRSSGVQKALTYEWSEFLGKRPSDFGLVFLRPDNTLHPAWFIFFDANPRLYRPRITVASRVAATRSMVPNRTIVLGRKCVN